VAHSKSAASAGRPPLAMVAACLAAVYIVWGTTYLAIKIGLEEVGPFFLLGTRLVVAGSVLLLAMKLAGARFPTLKQWMNAGLLGFLLLVVGIGSVSVAEKSVSSGAAVALISVQPLAAGVWGALFGRKPRALEWAAIFVGVVGTVVMVLGQDFQASPAGTVLILIGVLSWSFASNVASRLDVPHGAVGFGAEMLLGGVIALVVSVLFGEHWHLPTATRVWGAWGYLVVFGSLIAFSAYRYLVDRVSPTLAATYAYVNPPVALFVGWWIGAERFSVNTFIGLPIVLVAVGLHAWSWKMATSEPAPAPLKAGNPASVAD
jgi:drug/metabolite transporter (DMT)-like permease